MKTTPSLLPEPRSYAGTAVMMWALTALPFGLLWSWLQSALQQRSFGETLPLGLVYGVLFGLFFGATSALFLKGETATVEVSDRTRFIASLNVAMSQLGFRPASQSDDFFTYKPTLQAGLAAGRMSIQLSDGQAVIVGPKMYVKKLLRRLVTE